MTFHFVLAPEDKREAGRSEIAKTLDDHLGKIAWPAGFRASDPQYVLTTMEDMTASEWTVSQPIDWSFISSAGRLRTNG